MRKVYVALAVLVTAFNCSVVHAAKHDLIQATRSHRHRIGPPQVSTTSAGVVQYTTPGTGLSAVYTSHMMNAGGIPSPGYLLTGNASGAVGWNIPAYGQPPFSVPNFETANIEISSSVNFAKNNGSPPFAIVLQTSDGVNHTCSGQNGHYQFHAGGSLYSAYSENFSPVIEPNSDTIVRAAFVFQGATGTVGFTRATVNGTYSPVGNQLMPGDYTFSTTNDSQFNYEP